MLSTASQFQSECQSASSALIGTHLNPDGDALGSAIALSLYFDAIGLANEVLCHHVPPANLEFLPHIEKVKLKPEMESHDLAVMLDLDSIERLGDPAEHLSKAKRLVVIDHHIPHEAPGDLRIIDQTAAATCAILARLLLEMDAEITPEMATCLLTGIVTDTGSFRFRNTNAEALMLASRLLEAGGNIGLVSEEIFQRKPLAAVRLLGFLLETMTLEVQNRVAWGQMTHDQFQLVGAKDEDTEGFVNEMLSISSVEIAALFRETKPDWVRVSLRSRGKHDVAAVAREFGGGGHHNAAGCSFDMPISEVVSLVVPRMRECLGSH